MKNFVIVPASEGPQREFKITRGCVSATACRAGSMISRRRSEPTRNCSDDRWAGDRPQLGRTHETVAYLARN
jgi:hypothetical protein